jgi:hypothetical protein
VAPGAQVANGKTQAIGQHVVFLVGQLSGKIAQREIDELNPNWSFTPGTRSVCREVLVQAAVGTFGSLAQNKDRLIDGHSLSFE